MPAEPGGRDATRSLGGEEKEKRDTPLLTFDFKLADVRLFDTKGPTDQTDQVVIG